jgi:choline dehydrogenase-like flavoprotein
MPESDHYDVVIIGTGAGGGTLAWKLAPSGKRILLLGAWAVPPPRARQLGHDSGLRAGQVPLHGGVAER